MGDFKRSNGLFSLCGLNCGLCTMGLGGHCPGCGMGKHHSCPIARCSLERGGVQYCFECERFPCKKYDGIDAYDSFITHKNQLSDIQKAQQIGIDAYNAEQAEKIKILNFLLGSYNAGRQKAFFALAVNLLKLEDLRAVMGALESGGDMADWNLKQKAERARRLLEERASKQNIVLKLRKKPIQ